MHWLLMIAGGLAAVIGLMNGLASSPQSAPQQAVQRLDFVIGMLGLGVMGIGYIAGRLRSIAGAAEASKTVSAGSQSDKGPAVASEA